MNGVSGVDIEDEEVDVSIISNEGFKGDGTDEIGTYKIKYIAEDLDKNQAKEIKVINSNFIESNSSKSGNAENIVLAQTGKEIKLF